MRKLILTMLLSSQLMGCLKVNKPDFYTKEELDAGLDRILKPVFTDIELIKKKLFPEAYALSEKSKCTVDVKTLKCIETPNEKN